jgi:chemotaxis protein CheX
MGSIDEEIMSVAGDIWLAVLGLPLSASAPGRDALSPDDTLTGSVAIDGAWHGTISLQCSGHFAKRAASLMFGMDAAEVGSAEVHDALGELANMVSGNVKALLPGPCRLSLPSVAPGPIELSLGDGDVERQIWFECDADPIIVRLVTVRFSLARAELR